jgi:DNA-directed RNA polymerase subunit RPC12/RpoP
VIKFRCPRCTQKIAVNDEGVGVAISCPTCGEKIVVPPQSTAEFRLLPAVPVRFSDGTQSLPEESERAALRPHLARMMMDKLVQALVHQRRGLMETQESAARRVEHLEQRLECLQDRIERRLATYEHRIGELQADLAAKEKENNELASANLRLARRAMELERLREAVVAESRDAGLLLRT